MTAMIAPADIAMLDILRKRGALSVSELAAEMDVTATAVRQRLNRLMAQSLITRDSSREGRGRPTHYYHLTEEGRRQSGANFADLAIALWQEIQAIDDDEVKQGLMERLARRLAGIYAARMHGRTLEERMSALMEFFCERNMPVSLDRDGDLPVLQVEACPYPGLAEQDRTICSMEQHMMSELLGEEMQLNGCRLDGKGCCSFAPQSDKRLSPAGASC